MNLVAQNRDALLTRNYVIKAAPEGKYWLNIYRNRLRSIRAENGKDFFIIIYGSPDVDNDFFAIPFPRIKSVLVEETLTQPADGKHPIRWIGSIRDKKLRVTNSDVEIDLDPYYGNVGLLRRALERAKDETYPTPDQGAYEEETGPSYRPVDSDWRRKVFRQIRERRGQQKFRDALRKRYGDRCMISGCCLMDVIEAAHIRPYRGEKDNHPENGLLLRADLHTLFDLDMLGIEPHTLIVRKRSSAALWFPA